MWVDEPRQHGPSMTGESDVILDGDEVTLVGSVGVRRSEGDPDTIVLNSEHGNLHLGTDGHDGDLFLTDDEGERTVHVDGEVGNAKLGGNGQDGDLFLTKQDGGQTMHLDAQWANATFGGHDEDGDLFLKDGDGNRTIRLNGEWANARLGGSDQDGDLFLDDGDGRTRVHLDSGHGPVERDEVRVYLDGDTGEATLGGAGVGGGLHVKDVNDRENGTLADGKLTLGGDGWAGRLSLEGATGSGIARIDGDTGTATFGGIGGSGDVVVRETVESSLETGTGDDEPPTQFVAVVTDAGTVEPQSDRLTVDDDFVLVLESQHGPTDLQLSVTGPASQLVTLPSSSVTVDGVETMQVAVEDAGVAARGVFEIETPEGATATVQLEVSPEVSLGGGAGGEIPVPTPRVHLDGDSAGPTSPSVRSHLAGDATLTLGGDGESGTVRLLDGDGDAVGEVGVEDGELVLGDGSGGPELAWDPSTGDLTVRDAGDTEALSFDATTGDLEIAGSLTENAGN